MECLRCGTCCTMHPAYVSQGEIRRITAYLGITADDWTSRYAGDGPDYHGFLPVRQKEKGCVFLSYNGNIASCQIHPVKPDCCADWEPDPAKEECRRGIERCKKLSTE